MKYTYGLIVMLCLLASCATTLGPMPSAYNASCVTTTSVYEVRGGSLSGLVNPGADVKVLEGYQRCNDLKRGDLVLYNYSGDAVPLIKVVKAVPGDHWYLNGSAIIVDNETLTNSEGVAFSISDTRRLALYAHDYPVIPANTYLLMGNLAGGSLDSSVFGLVSRTDILGLAIPPGQS